MSAIGRAGCAAVWVVGFAALLGLVPKPGVFAREPPQAKDASAAPARGDEVGRFPSHRGPVKLLAYRDGGRTLATGGADGVFRLCDAATGKLRRELELRGEVMAVSPDCWTIVCRPDNGHLLPTTMFLWDSVTRRKKVLKHHPSGVRTAALSPDGKVLATGEAFGTVHLSDTATAREIRHLEGGHTQAIFVLAFAPGGRILASGGAEGKLCLWDTATGKRLHQVVARDPKGPQLDALGPTPGEASVDALAFSADGKVLAAADGKVSEQWLYGRSMTLHLWDTATGKRIRHFAAPQGDDFQPLILALALSPDGRTLAGAGSDGLVWLWETATGGERRHFSGHRGVVWSVAFAPDGKRLASGGDDGTVLVWEVLSAGPQGAPPNANRLVALWSALADANAGKGYRAVHSLLAAPRQAVPLLKAKLTPMPAVDRERIGRLIRDFDSPRFAVRNRAALELLKWGELALPSVREALAGKPTLEVRQRLEQAVQRVEAEHLRGLRAVEVLEHLGTAEARALLEAVAAGEPRARLTREAQATLRRMGEVPPRKG